MRRTLRYLSELTAALVAILVVLTIALAWQLNRAPIEATYLTPYMEEGLKYLNANISPSIGSTLLVWDNEDRTIALQADRVVLRDPQNKIIAELPALRVKVSLLGILQGRLVPSELSIIQPHILLHRHADGSVVFASEGSSDSASGKGTAAIEVLRNLADDLVHESLLRELAMRHASLVVRDEASNAEWSFDAPEVVLRQTSNGLEGHAGLSMQGDHPAKAKADYAYDEASKTHRIRLSVTDINPSHLQLGKGLEKLGAFDLSLSGSVEMSLDDNLTVLSASADLRGNDGKVTLPDLWDNPKDVKQALLKGSFAKDTGKISVENLLVDFGQTRIEAKVDGARPEDPSFDEAVTVTAKVSQLPMDGFADLWPKVAVPGARDWISSNMSKGIFTEANAVLKARFKWADIDNMVLDSADGTVSAKGGHVKYIDGAPAVEGVNAEAKFDLTHMDVALSSGSVGALKLLPSTVHMTDFDKEVQNIDIPLKMAGPVRDVLRIMDAPSLGYAKAVGLKPDETEGKMEGLLEVRLPLLKDILLKDVAIKADAKLQDFAAKKLIPGIEISQANLELSVTQDGFTVKGLSALNKVPFQVAFEGSFLPGKPKYQATVTGAVAGDQWKTLGLDAFSHGEGTSLVSLRFVQPDAKTSRLSGEVNFKQAGFDVEQLGWKKTIGVPATLVFAIEQTQGKPAQIKSVELSGGASLRVKGTGLYDGASGRLLNLELKPMILGRTNASLHFSQGRDEKAPLQIAVEGDSFDASGLTGGREPDTPDHRAKDYALKLGKLYTSDKGFIANVEAKAVRDKVGWDRIELHGQAQGETQMDISLAPKLGDPAKRVFDAKCADFGKMLKAMGFTDTVRSGELTVTGESSPEDPRTIVGEVTIGSFTVTGLPVLARLVNAASPFGFADLVTGEASFSRLKGDYKWHGDQIELEKTRLSGSVYGINVDGRVDMNSGETDINGTLVPFSFVNRVIGSIPVVGNLITGGEGEGVLAVNYGIKGKLSEPKISVNPASLLTPGFLRDLFFDNSPSATKP
jgi:hypothetical protein